MIQFNPAVAHLATEADEYKGYYIPKGTVIFGNSWSVHPISVRSLTRPAIGRSCMIQRSTKTLLCIIPIDS